MWYISSFFLFIYLFFLCIYFLFTVTNAPKENAEFLLRVLKVQHYFEFVVLGDDCEAGKPHPAPYLSL